MFKILQKIKNKINKDEKGVTLLIAVTTMTLLLSIGLSISNIVLRQIRITNINNASKPAFFTADSAIECAFYYDTLKIADPDSTEDDSNINEDFEKAVFGKSTLDFKKNTIHCGNGPILAVSNNFDDTLKIMTTNFDVDYGTMCAKVTVERSDVSTRITSRGYNTNADANGCNLADVSKRRLVERGLTIKY